MGKFISERTGEEIENLLNRIANEDPTDNATLIRNCMNIKPTVRIFYSTNPDRASIYAYHPYLAYFGSGELVVMKYGKSSTAKWVNPETRGHVSKAGWHECLGAPINIEQVEGRWKWQRFTEPAKLQLGNNSYIQVLEDICARATRDMISVGEGYAEYNGFASMAQIMAYERQPALAVLQAHFYDHWENLYPELPEYSIFGAHRNRLILGVALRVLNPEFQKLLDGGVLSSHQFESRHWYYDKDSGATIPKYLYSGICEMYLSAGSMQEMVRLGLPRIPRLSLKG